MSVETALEIIEFHLPNESSTSRKSTSNFKSSEKENFGNSLSKTTKTTTTTTAAEAAGLAGAADKADDKPAESNAIGIITTGAKAQPATATVGGTVGAKAAGSATASRATAAATGATAAAAAAVAATNAQDVCDAASGTELRFSTSGTNAYRIIKTLGKGNFAKVKLAMHLPTGCEVAIKIIDKTQLNGSAKQKLYREVRIMKQLHHPNIVRLYQVIETERSLYLIMEYACRGELFDHLVKNGRMREREARVLFRQLISAVQYCHSKYVVHRDLKAENLLLDANMNIKIADFGFGNIYDPKSQLETFCGSPPYAAPELFMGRKYAGPEVDVWSLGVVLYTLVSGSLPFDGSTLKELRERVLRGKYRVPYYISMDCENLMRKFLVLNPDKRSTLTAVMGDKWINIGYEAAEYLRPYKEQPMQLQDAHRVDQLVQMGFKRTEVENSLRNKSCDDIYCSYMLLEVAQSKGLSIANGTGAAAAKNQANGAEKVQNNSGRPLPSRPSNTVPVHTLQLTSTNGVGGGTALPPVKPTRRYNRKSLSSSARGSPQTPAAPTKRSGIDVKPTLLSAQRQQAQAQKLSETPPRYHYVSPSSSTRRPATVYEKGESTAPMHNATPKPHRNGNLLARLQLVAEPASRTGVAAATPESPAVAAKQSAAAAAEKAFGRNNITRATFHFGQSRSSKSCRQGAETPPLSADDSKPASRVSFFSKLTARFGRRVIHLNEKDVSEQRKNLTK